GGSLRPHALVLHCGVLATEAMQEGCRYRLQRKGTPPRWGGGGIPSAACVDRPLASIQSDGIRARAVARPGGGRLHVVGATRGQRRADGVLRLRDDRTGWRAPNELQIGGELARAHVDGDAVARGALELPELDATA